MKKPAIHFIENGSAAERLSEVTTLTRSAVDAGLGYCLRTYTLEDGTRAYEVIVDAEAAA